MTKIRNQRLLRQVEQKAGGFMDMDAAFEWICDMKDAMKDNNIRWCLLFGTLLGAVREGDFIKHDHDIDTGAVRQDRDKEAALIKSLEMRGFKPYPVTIPDHRPEARFLQMNNKIVPGHMTWLLRYWQEPKYWKSIMVYKPKTAKIRGEKFPIPDHVEEYLHMLYGDWRTERFPSDPLSFIGAWNKDLHKRTHA